MKLVINKKYWVLIDYDHDEIIDKEDFENLVEVTYQGVKNDDVANVRHIFIPCEQPVTKKLKIKVVLSEMDTEQWVFNNPHEYLLYLVNHVRNLNDNFDDQSASFDKFMIKKIKKSQKNFPEYWV